MTLILKIDLDMVKMYLHTKNEVSMSRGSKVIAWTDRNTDTQTDRQTDRETDTTENITYPHTRVITMENIDKAYHTLVFINKICQKLSPIWQIKTA